jgi:hypothetical protein
MLSDPKTGILDGIVCHHCHLHIYPAHPSLCCLRLDPPFWHIFLPLFDLACPCSFAHFACEHVLGPVASIPFPQYRSGTGASDNILLLGHWAAQVHRGGYQNSWGRNKFWKPSWQKHSNTGFPMWLSLSASRSCWSTSISQIASSSCRYCL